MRGAWRSALLVVAAALEPAEGWEGEEQQQQQHEEQQQRQPHVCVAGAVLVCVANSSGRKPPRLRCGAPRQTDTRRMGKLGTSCAAFFPTYSAARRQAQQQMRL